MDIARILVSMLGAALIALTIWFFFGKRTSPGDKAVDGPYACPMHPWITSSDPAAECSVCGMKLVRR